MKPEKVKFLKSNKQLVRKDSWYSRSENVAEFPNRVFTGTMQLIEVKTTGNGYPLYVLKSVETGLIYTTNNNTFNRLLKRKLLNGEDGHITFFGYWTIKSRGGYNYLSEVGIPLVDREFSF